MPTIPIQRKVYRLFYMTFSTPTTLVLLLLVLLHNLSKCYWIWDQQICGSQEKNVNKRPVFAESVEEPDINFVVTLFDGIFDLGFDGGTVNGIVPPINNAFNQGLITEKKFAFALGDVNTQGFRSTGSFTFGGYDATKFTGDLIEIPIDKLSGPHYGANDIYIIFDKSGLKVLASSKMFPISLLNH